MELFVYGAGRLLLYLRAAETRGPGEVQTAWEEMNSLLHGV